MPVKGNNPTIAPILTKLWIIIQLLIPIAVSFKKVSEHSLAIWNPLQAKVKISDNKYNDSFDFMIDGNKLVVTRTDEPTGWGHEHSCDIIIECDERVFLFQEYKGETGATSCYVDYKNEKILDSRDKIYYRNGGW